MRSFIYFIVLYINFLKNRNANAIQPLTYIKEEQTLNCQNGTLLTTEVCVPNGYLKGESPEKPTLVNIKVDINNIREVNNKKMCLTLDFAQEMSWIDNRIQTRFLKHPSVSVLNNNLINHIWKPDLWIKNLFDFHLHKVLHPTGGLIVMGKEYCPFEVNCTETETRRNTRGWLNN